MVGRNWRILLDDSTDGKWLIAQDDLDINWHNVQGTSNDSILLHRAFQVTVSGILYRVLQLIVSSLVHRAFQISQWHILQSATNDSILLPGHFRYRAYIVMREHLQFLQHFVLP